MRPELEKLSATIQLPKYLQIPETFSKDVRGGAITVVRGATLAFQSKTSKQIAEASANAVSLPVQDGAFSLAQRLMYRHNTHRVAVAETRMDCKPRLRFLC